MDIQSTRVELAKMILNETSETILEQVKNLFEQEKKAFDAAFERAVADKEAGRTKPHTEVKKKYKKWL